MDCRVQFAGVVVARGQYADQWQSGGIEHGLDIGILRLSCGFGVRGLIEFKGDEGGNGCRFAEEKVDGFSAALFCRVARRGLA